jgi:bacillithiol system protein YtxJ
MTLHAGNDLSHGWNGQGTQDNKEEYKPHGIELFWSVNVIMQDNSLKSMNWIPLQTESQLEDIKNKSALRPQLIFKHSTRCSTSAVVKGRLERAAEPKTIDFYYLDLLNYRPISNKIVDTFQIGHESPQVLLIRNGECVYDESHMGITMDDIVGASAF